MSESNPIILFDGVCNLCNKTVQFVIKKDREKKFRFASLQGSSGQRILKDLKIPADIFHSFILLEDDKVYERSTAALRLLKLLGRGWQFFYIFILLPKPIRDGIYNWISRNRYKWFGKKDSCMIPEGGVKDRFLN